MKVNQYLLAVLCLASSQVHAQGFLSDLKKLRDNIENDRTNRQERPIPSYKSDLSINSSNSGNAEKNPNENVTPRSKKVDVATPDMVCERLKQSIEVKELAVLSRKYVDLKTAIFNPTTNISFMKKNYDTKDHLINESVNNLFGIRFGRNTGCGADQGMTSAKACSQIDPIIDAIHYCSMQLMDENDDMAYLFYNENRSESSTLRLEKERDNPKNEIKRTIDPSGKVITTEIVTKRFDRQTYDPNRYNIPLLLILSDDEYSKTVLKNTLPEIMSKISADVEQMQKVKDIRDNELKQRQAERTKEKLNEEAATKFLDSPEGKLYKIYRFYAILKTCHDARKGYQSVYISDTEMKGFTENVKDVEKILKPNLKENSTSQVWEKASADGKRVGEMVSNNSNFQKAQSGCSEAKTLFKLHVENLIGSQKMKKDF